MKQNEIDPIEIHPGIKAVMFGSKPYALHHRGNGVFRLRQKPGVSKEMVMTDPRFQRTREAGKLFGNGSKYAKLLRIALGQQGTCPDGTMVTRLQKLMLRCLKGDKTPPPLGGKMAMKGDVSIFNHFHFNNKKKPRQHYFNRLVCLIDREAGSVMVGIPSFTPGYEFTHRGSANLFKLTLVIAGIDFEQQTFSVQEAATQYLTLNEHESGLIELRAQLPVDLAKPVFAVIKTEFYKGAGASVTKVAAGNNDLAQIIGAEGSVGI